MIPSSTSSRTRRRPRRTPRRTVSRSTVRRNLAEAAVETIRADPRLALSQPQREGLAGTTTRRRSSRTPSTGDDRQRLPSDQQEGLAGTRTRRRTSANRRTPVGDRGGPEVARSGPRNEHEQALADLRAQVAAGLSPAGASVRDPTPGALGDLIETIDVVTGIPTAIRDPSPFNISMAVLGVLPAKALTAPLATTSRTARALGRATRAGLPIREIAREGARAALPAAGSRTGRLIERTIDKVMPRGLQLRQIALENARSTRIANKVKTAPASALRRLRLRASEETALRLAAEGGTLADQEAYYATRAANASDASSRLYHGIHADLVKQASKWLEDVPGGKIVLKQDAPRRLKEAWRLLGVVDDTREDIYKALGKLTDERIVHRINAPGRVIQGARWDDAVRVTDELGGEDVLPGALVGFEDFAGGQRYIAERMGTPGLGSASGRGALRGRVGSINPKNLARQATATLTGGRGRAIAGVHRDPSLTHAYTGALKESGFFRTDVSNIVGESLATATRLDGIRQYRARLLAAASDTYVPGYIAIKAVPEERLSGDLKELWAKLELVERGGLTPRDMRKLGLNDDLAEQLARTLFAPATDVTKGVKWVPAELVDKSALGNLVSKTFDWGPGKPIGVLLDVYNDLQRAAILYLNPAYGPVNLIGNTVMNLFQQGVFYPANIMKAFKLFRELSPEGLATVRELIGTGLTKAIGTAGTPGVKQVTRTIGDLIQVGSDSMPRWTAFVHAAREFKLKTAEDFDNLFAAARAGDQQSMDVIERITRKANDAIVDFERLTPFERNVVSRIVFFYPWLRGATRYSLRFPLEHPVQTAALGFAGYEGKKYADEKLGDRPFYSQFELPIPGMEDAEGNPYVINVRQLLTFTTPFELGEAAVAFATGDRNAPQIVENLIPSIQHGITALTGRNEYGEDVGPGVGTFLRESLQDLPPARLYESISTADEDRSDRLYPRTERDEYVRLGLGGIAPKPFNTRVAAKQAADLRSEKSSAKTEPLKFQELSQWALESDQVGPQSKAMVRKWRRMESIIRQRTKQRAERDGRNFSDLRGSLVEYTIKLQVLKQVRPDVVGNRALRILKENWLDVDAQEDMKRQINDWIEFADEFDGSRLSTQIERHPARLGEQVADQFGF